MSEILTDSQTKRKIIRISSKKKKIQHGDWLGNNKENFDHNQRKFTMDLSNIEKNLLPKQKKWSYPQKQSSQPLHSSQRSDSQRQEAGSTDEQKLSDRSEFLSGNSAFMDESEFQSHRPFYLQTSRHTEDSKSEKLLGLVKKYQKKARNIWKGAQITDKILIKASIKMAWEMI